ncbi:zinc finger protein 830 [Octopus bimaculoides]|uniref:Zinc finger protein 830 n=1 Tax=Octopus bimaculoides TaxID=37653 RepID=A0A0L8HQ93_OCTBM|nr:zinc finger protein 830 [Octopus bimaculoides]|eukprot:XP_014770746.1 PREDICTED: zinc finger protein 830-like [Octopus bimaculoides]
MAAFKKKSVSKDDLRRLMKETKINVRSKDKKVDHPHAKYNCLGQLVCTVCNTALKSSLLWNAHLQGRQHKENLVSQNEKQQDLQQINLLKRKLAETNDEHDSKKPKASILKNSLKTNSSNLSNKISIPIVDESDDSVSDSDSEADLSETKDVSIPSEKSTDANSATASSLPKDFFDSGLAAAENENKDEAGNDSESKIANVLPEGFFDDPVIDAKVRQVEYKDKMEEEWELFQKQMKEEAHVSEAIIEDDDEQANVDRNIDEIDEQIHRWSQINDLQDQKEKIMQVKSQKNHSGDGSEDDDSISADDFKDFLDWRSKKPWT